MKLLWNESAWTEYCEWQTDKTVIKKINELLKEIQRTPFEGKGKPEPLKGNFSGWWSRRIDEKNRIVYKPSEDTIIIASCKNHYSDK